MLKLATFRGVTPAGDPLAQVFRQGDSIRKIAGAMMPSVQDWLSTYKSDREKIALLVNALGASEFWGSNVNGDIFNTPALVHNCADHPGTAHPVDDFTGKIIPPYGAWTFQQYAKAYVHHKNKDPNRAFGDVVHWVWNPRMHRVELVVVIDRAAALQHGAQHVVDRVDAGEFPDVSMGTKVPYDICTICGNKSKTRHDYCSCVKEIGMGRILDDGRRIGVINTYPRFFDISFVFIGADKTAKVMCKLGSGLVVPLSAVEGEYIYGSDLADPDGGMLKAAFEVQDYSLDGGKVISNFYGNRRSTMTGAAGRGLEITQDPDEPTSFSAREEVTDPARRQEALGHLMSRAEKAKDRHSILSGKYWGARSRANEIQSMMDKGAAVDRILTLAKEASPPDISTFAEETATHDADVTPSHMKLHRKIVDRQGNVIDKILPPPEETTGLMMSKEDPQESTTDGLLRTNMTTGGIDDGDGGDTTKEAGLGLNTLKQVGKRFGKGVASGHKNITEASKTVGTSYLGAQTPNPLIDKEAALKNWALAEAAKNRGLFKTAGATCKECGKEKVETENGVECGCGVKVGVDIKKALKSQRARKLGLDTVYKRAKETKVGPPPMPNRKEFPFVGTINFRGIEIGVENAADTWRTGKGWKTRMRLPYGEFLHSKAGGMDGDKLDVYVGPFKNAKNVYIIHQNHVRGPSKGKYDEDKVMLGLDTPEQAIAAYRDHYDSDKYFRSLTTMAFPLFKSSLIGGQIDGEKVASAPSELENRRADLKLEDLFSNSGTAQRRQRTWRDKETGKELNVTGSGMDHDEAIREKVASVKTAQPFTPRELLKMSAMKAADQQKWADIVKEIGPGKATGKVTELLDDDEPSLPGETLDNMCSAGGGLEGALSTPSMMGMVLKPEEFQRVMLSHMGKQYLGDELDRSGAVFKPSDEEEAPCGSLGAEHVLPALLKQLMPHLEAKSYLGPVLKRRIIRVIIKKPGPSEPLTEVDSPLLSKVASAYNWYRREQMKLAMDTPEFIQSVPTLREGVYDLRDYDLFREKTAAGMNAVGTGLALGSVPLSLMYSAHLRKQQRMGMRHGMVKNMVAEHPWLTTLGAAAGMRKLLSTPTGRSVTKGIGEFGSALAGN